MPLTGTHFLRHIAGLAAGYSASATGIKHDVNNLVGELVKRKMVAAYSERNIR
jgi:hypothetical protein